MAKLPPVNAALSRVQAPDLKDDYDGTVIAPGEVRFEGEAPAYATEQVLVETGRGAVDQLEIARLVVPSYVEVRTGDRLTFTKAGVTTTRTAQNIEERSDYGFVRLYLRPA